MAHRIESMAFHGESPWHGIGVRMETPPATMVQAMIAAGLTWPVESREIVVPGEGGEPIPSPRFRAIVRPAHDRPAMPGTDERPGEGGLIHVPASVLGVVSDRYELIQPVDHFRAFDPAIAEGRIRVETVMSLDHGRRIAACVRLPDADGTVAGDVVRAYGVVYGSFDGSRAVDCYSGLVRAVCANTLASGLASASARARIRHVAGATEALAEATEALTAVESEIGASLRVYSALADVTFGATEIGAFLDAVAPLPSQAEIDAADDPAGLRTRRANVRQSIADAIRSAPGGVGDSARPSAWLRIMA